MSVEEQERQIIHTEYRPACRGNALQCIIVSKTFSGLLMSMKDPV